MTDLEILSWRHTARLTVPPARIDLQPVDSAEEFIAKWQARSIPSIFAGCSASRRRTATLDETVAAAYGWPADLPDEQEE